MKFRKVTASLGYRPCTVDPELELKHHNGTLVGAIAKHVDDVKAVCAETEYKDLVDAISKVFGKPEEHPENDFVCVGLRHQRHADGSWSMDQQAYASAIQLCSMPELVGKAPEELLTEVQQRRYLSSLMTVAYLTVSRPDIAVYVAALQRTSHKRKVTEVRKLNAIIRWVKANPCQLVFKVPPTPMCSLLVMSDAGFAAEHDSGRSHRGAVVLLAPKTEFSVPFECTVHLLDWASSAQRRVTRSTYASELYAAVDAYDSSLLLRQCLLEVRTGNISASHARLEAEASVPRLLPLVLCIDAKSVFQSVASRVPRIPAEKNLVVQIQWLKEELELFRLSDLLWLDTRSMSADGLTKGSISRDALH
eukprot:3620375-Amphidinium_carterae.1